jgi:RND family efflux transporter MFP subunit
LLGALAFLPGSCAAPAHERPDAKPVALSVELAPVRREPFALTYRASGTVRGRNTAVLTSKTLGYVRAVHVASGDTVAAGQPLAVLEANDARAGVSAARAELASSLATKTEAQAALEAAKVAVELAKRTHERVSALRAARVVSQQELDDTDARLRGAVAGEQVAQARLLAVTSGIERARATLAESEVVLGYSKIVAPFAGRVLERRVDPGTLASPNVPLFVIADGGPQRVEVAVEESRIPELRLGDEAVLELEGATEPLHGQVTEIVPNVDVASRAFVVKLDLPSAAPNLRPGTFARAVFRAGVEPRLVVPTTAITRFGALERVFVVERGVARLRMIAPGETQGPWTAVLSGLSEQERVVRAPARELRDGQPVEVVR